MIYISVFHQGAVVSAGPGKIPFIRETVQGLNPWINARPSEKHGAKRNKAREGGGLLFLEFFAGHPSGRSTAGYSFITTKCCSLNVPERAS